MALAPGGLWTSPDPEDESSGPLGKASGLPRGRPCTRNPGHSFQTPVPDQPLSSRSPPWGRTHGGGAPGVHPAVREPLITTQGLGGLPPSPRPLPVAWGQEGCECNLVLRMQPGSQQGLDLNACGMTLTLTSALCLLLAGRLPAGPPRVVSRVQGGSVLRAGRQGKRGSPSGSRGLEARTAGVPACVPASVPAPAPP